MIKTINARFDCRGYYLRWYFNGWHHYFFKVADEILQTEGEIYQTQMSTKLVVGDDNIRKNQMLAFTGLMRSKHIFMLTEDGWKACTIVDTDLPYGRADHPGARVEFTLNVWAKKGLFTPLLAIEIIPAPPAISYGYLYNWYVTQEQISSDVDWDVPTDSELTALSDYLIATYIDVISDNVGNYVKSTRFEPLPHPRWDIGTQTHYDIVGLDFYGGGWRNFDTGTFVRLGVNGLYWSATTATGITSYYRSLSTNAGTISRFSGDIRYGFSLKLVRDATASEIANNIDGQQCDPYKGNDDKRYKTVYINEKVWLAENLAETKYRNGTDIPKVTESGVWTTISTPAYCAYDNNESYAINS